MRLPKFSLKRCFIILVIFCALLLFVINLRYVTQKNLLPHHVLIVFYFVTNFPINLLLKSFCTNDDYLLSGHFNVKFNLHTIRNDCPTIYLAWPRGCNVIHFKNNFIVISCKVDMLVYNNA